MAKVYIVKLTDEERGICTDVIARLSATSQKVCRAHILRQCDIDGPGWTDELIAEAYHCRARTVANVRKRFVEQGFEFALHGKDQTKPSRPRILDGAGEARLIATRLGNPPTGFGSWSLRLLAEQVVELGIAESISHETCRTILKKAV